MPGYSHSFSEDYPRNHPCYFTKTKNSTSTRRASHGTSMGKSVKAVLTAMALTGTTSLPVWLCFGPCAVSDLAFMCPCFQCPCSLSMLSSRRSVKAAVLIAMVPAGTSKSASVAMLWALCCECPCLQGPLLSNALVCIVLYNPDNVMCL